VVPGPVEVICTSGVGGETEIWGGKLVALELRRRWAHDSCRSRGPEGGAPRRWQWADANALLPVGWDKAQRRRWLRFCPRFESCLTSVEPLKLFVGMISPSLTIKKWLRCDDPLLRQGSPGWIDPLSLLLDEAKLASLDRYVRTPGSRNSVARVTTPSMVSFGGGRERNWGVVFEPRACRQH